MWRHSTVMTCCTIIYHQLCQKQWIKGQDNFYFTFSFDSNLGVHSLYNPNLILSPVTFFSSSKLKERLAVRKFTRVQDLSLVSKAVRYFRAQRSTCFSVPICSSDVAEVARNVCGQWRDVLWTLVEVWWRCVHWFPFYISCDRTFGLALVRWREQHL